jgi:hypothetical protein
LYLAFAILIPHSSLLPPDQECPAEALRKVATRVG